METSRTWIGLLGLALTLDPGSGAAGEPRKAETGTPAVVVYVRQDNITVPELGRAEETARRIFGGIGVTLVFRRGASGKSGNDAVTIEIELRTNVPSGFHPEALAYATPFAVSGTLIQVFCDRVLKLPGDISGAYLGHVMAHEIGHVLEGVSRHSAEGVMKARFETTDFHQMRSGPLAFDPTDVELIRTGLEKRATRSAAADSLAQRTAHSGRRDTAFGPTGGHPTGIGNE